MSSRRTRPGGVSSQPLGSGSGRGMRGGGGGDGRGLEPPILFAEPHPIYSTHPGGHGHHGQDSTPMTTTTARSLRDRQVAPPNLTRLQIQPSSSSSEEEEEQETDSEDEVRAKKKRRSKSPSKSGGGGGGLTPPEALGLGKKGKKGRARDGIVLSQKDMIHNTLLYLLTCQHKKLPIKRPDIIKFGLNHQNKAFPEVMKSVTDTLEDVFGMKVIGLEPAPPRKTSREPVSGFISYIITSKFPLSMSDCITKRDGDVDLRRTMLFFILATIFMQNRSIDEETIWKIVTRVRLHELDDSSVSHMCKKQEDLRRFLKTEYVSNMYLKAEEVQGPETTIIRYTWGPRAEKEFSKYNILKFVTKQFQGKKPYDFTIPYGIAMEHEKELIENDTEDYDEVTDEVILDGSGSEPFSQSSGFRSMKTPKTRSGDGADLASDVEGSNGPNSNEPDLEMESENIPDDDEEEAEEDNDDEDEDGEDEEEDDDEDETE